MSDNFKPTFTFAALERLDKEAAPAPFTFGIAGRVITFPDPLGISPEEAEEFAQAMEGASSPTAVLKKWLDDKDADLLLSKLSMRQLALLIRKASVHYQSALGLPGEGDASTTD
ncbi:hypothetical protein [Kytococcus sedentarius]|uniref:hypothetical protein n=1 Tax=Kytococcus sedentarius TaxID=1276 RepID=UPI0006608F24|nr:hypothetical protein [Kytococcus sedentarius]